MTIDNILDVVTEFTNRLQLPESKYKFIVTSSNELVELVIMVEDTVKSSLKISNGNVSVLYTDEYNSDKYVAMDFLTPVSLLYLLCILFYAAIHECIQLDFNELLSVVLLEEVYDWKTLVYGLAENLGIPVTIEDNYVTLDQCELHYNTYINQIRIDNTEIDLEGRSYTDIVEAMFKCVEYVANLMGVADTLFMAEAVEEEEVPEGEEDNVTEGGFSGGDMDIDMDVDMGGGEEAGGEAEPVEPMETETFEEPQGPVVTMDDLL